MRTTLAKVSSPLPQFAMDEVTGEVVAVAAKGLVMGVQQLHLGHRDDLRGRGHVFEPYLAEQIRLLASALKTNKNTIFCFSDPCAVSIIMHHYMTEVI